MRKLATTVRACVRTLTRRRRAVLVIGSALAIVALQAGLVSAGGAATTSGVSTAAGLHATPGSLKSEFALAKRSGRFASHVTVRHSYRNDVSRPLSLIPAVHRGPSPEREALPNLKPGRSHHNAPDAARQTELSASKMPSPNFTFEGVDFPGVNCFCAPPDTNGEVGLSQYVQIVNIGFQVFNKATGASVFGPVDIATLWSGFGGACEDGGAGDPVVLYDQLANRWVIAQFATATGDIPITDECVAVSRTSDATGTWNRYGFHLGEDFFDYPKIGVWPDAYYMSMNVFNAEGTAYLGPQPFAFDRDAMLAGDSATFITTGITNGPSEDPYLPADLDGSTPPPANAPDPFVEFPGTGHYKVYRFDVDWGTPANSTFTLAGSPSAASFTKLCQNTANCVPQLGVNPSTDYLDALADRLMFRAAYRNFGTSESLVSNFTVSSSGVAGIRWFELNHLTSSTPTVVQENTYQPDSTWRWMGSIAADNDNDMALGYSASSSTINPQIRYAGRLASDTPSTLPQAEAHLFNGTGSQADTFHRWGDYSDMTVDPVDDCTFWYTQEYYATTGSFDWRTRIGNFTFPSCTGPSGANVTIAKTADASSAPAGDQIGFTVELVNSGPDDATGLAITDSLPSGTDVNWTIDAGDTDAGWSVTGSPPNQSLTYTPTTLAGSSATHVHVVSSTTTNSCGDYDNSASFTAPGGLSGSDSDSTSVSCLTISKTADAPSTSAGSQIGFTVTLDNLESTAATGLSVTDDLPSGTGVDWSVDTSDPGWSVTGSPPNESLDYAPTTLAGNTSTEVHVVSNTTTQSCGDYVNTASFTSDNEGSGEASDVETVFGCPDVAIFKAADDNVVAAGTLIGFGVEVDNFGDATATGLTITDHLPHGAGVNWVIDFVDGTAGWSITGAPPNQSLAYSPTTLASGDFTFVHVASTTNTGSCGAYNNTAQFATSNDGSGSSSDSVSVLGCPPAPPPPPPPLFRTLTVAKSGSGTGTVTSSPAGIDCGPSCTAQFSNGTSVTLSETPSSSSRFTGWSGDCSGTGACVLTMTADHSVTAGFAKKVKCKVPKVVGLKLKKAKAKIKRAHCRVGKITRKFSSPRKKGRVLSQKPKPGKTLPAGSKVNLKVGKGPKRR